MKSIIIEFDSDERPGRGVATAKLDGEIIARDTLNLDRARDRERFASQVCEAREGIDPNDVEAALLQRLEEDNEPTTTRSRDDDLEDITRVERPELFHTPHVSGVAVPVVRRSSFGPRGHWLLYLRWSDGRREKRELADSLELPDKSRLWLWPMPGEPSPAQRASWSASARAAWLDGAAAVDPADVFQRLCRSVAFYLDFPPEMAAGAAATLSLWTILTYGFPVWAAVPYLAVSGPLGSGKTTLFRLLARLVFRPLETSNMTAPALFRTLHDIGGVLLLDEAERLRDGGPEAGELRSILLSGYKKGSPAIRLEKSRDGFKRIEFDVFGPKCLASIGSLPEALASRCIPIRMFRSDPSSPKPRRRLDDMAVDFGRLRDDLHAISLELGSGWLRLAADAGACPATLPSHDGNVALAGRDYELWQPMFALARWIESSGASGLVDVLGGFVATLIDSGRDDAAPEVDEILLRLLARHVLAGTQGALKAGELLKQARETEDALFRNWSAKGAANALKRYGLATRRGRGNTGRVYSGVTIKALRRIQSIYGMDLGIEPDSDG